MIARPTWDLPFDVGEVGPRWPPGWSPAEPNDPEEGSPTPRGHAPERVDPRWEPDDGWAGDRDANPGGVTRPEAGDGDPSDHPDVLPLGAPPLPEDPEDEGEEEDDGEGLGGDSWTEVPSSDPWTTHSTSDALTGRKTQSSGEGPG